MFTISVSCFALAIALAWRAASDVPNSDAIARLSGYAFIVCCLTAGYGLPIAA